ncbi:Transposase family Tnp2 protein [Ceratobasidium sp. AG-Ba]|nr:Transposase family Tnp2 protein [Ceratobasidium sp. AG-Ba]
MAQNRAQLVAQIAAARAQRDANIALEPDLGDDMDLEGDILAPEPNNTPGPNDHAPRDDPAFGNFEPAPVIAPPLPPGIDLAAQIRMEDRDLADGIFEPEPIEWGVEEDINDLFVLPPNVPVPAPAAYRNPSVVIEDWPNEEELEDIEIEDIDADDASVDSAEQEPEFHEHNGPLGEDADNKPEMDDEELRAYLRERLGDIAYEEWIKIFERDLTKRDHKTLRFLAARLRSHFSRATYDDLRLHACEELGLPSDFVAWQRLSWILTFLISRAFNQV